MTGSPPGSTKPDINASGFCRDCLTDLMQPQVRCPKCRSPRLLTHEEWPDLSIAHIDCDAFYAAVEKRDHPELADRPLIIGGETRGVVSTACYIARMYGVHSAMPMFQAKRLCPDAVIRPPNMALYREVGYSIRRLMEELTPLVEPVSIDEAFLDLTGTQRLHHLPPAKLLAQLAQTIEKTIGISVSIGLSHNKFLAKLASDLDKPRGFSIIGRAETVSRLAPMPVSKIWGVGRATQTKLSQDGISVIGQLQTMDLRDLTKRYNSFGLRLSELSQGIDRRRVNPVSETKSISSEETFISDINSVASLEQHLWRLCERTSARCKSKQLAGLTIVLKAKTSDFRQRTRNLTRSNATQMAEAIYHDARHMLHSLVKDYPKDAYRLIGVGVTHLVDAHDADHPDLAEPDRQRQIDTERAMDRLREKFGTQSVRKGRDLL